MTLMVLVVVATVVVLFGGGNGRGTYSGGCEMCEGGTL